MSLQSPPLNRTVSLELTDAADDRGLLERAKIKVRRSWHFLPDCSALFGLLYIPYENVGPVVPQLLSELDV